MNNFLQMIKSLSPGRLASISAIFIFLIAFFVYIASSVTVGDYSVLYKDLELSDAKQIVSKLEESKIKYRLAKNGTEILVPSSEVNKMRIDTADLALGSSGANVGYEIFDNSDSLGSTNFVQNVNLIRALEGELARTIRSVDNIQTARVHLVLPKREMFSKEELSPSASVVIKARNGNLDRKTVHSVQKLVAAAVPKLSVKNVAVVDTLGNLLTESMEDSADKAKMNNELLRFEYEKKLESQVSAMLERVVGEGRVKIKVNVDMDFDEEITNEEIYDPESQVVRSSSTITSDSKNLDGANGPVSVSQNIPNPDLVNNIAGGNSSESSKTEEVVNYEISKIIRNKVKTTGSVRRLTVAVMIDGIHVKNEKGEDVYTPRSEDEMERISTLVRSAVGYDVARGDTIEVENLRFMKSLTIEADEFVSGVFGSGFEKEDVIRAAEGLGVALVAVLVILLVIRPLINNAFDASSNVNDGTLVGEDSEDNLLLSNFINEDNRDIDELINLNKIDGRIKASSVKRINDIIVKNPEVSVNIIRNWLYQTE